MSERVFEHFMAFYLICGIIGLISAVVMGFVCRYIVKNKNYPPERNHGFLWGFFLGLIGLVVCAVKPNYFDTYEGRGGQPFDPNNPYNYPPRQGFNGVPPYSSQNFGGQQYGGRQYGQQYGGQPQYGTPQNAQSGQSQGQWQCSCGNMNDASSNFCSICGTRRMY